jgi:hypothetical protein
MGQKASDREIEMNEVARRSREGTLGLVQCDGCPARVLVRPARPGHRDDCELCSQHCGCFRVPDGIGPLYDDDEW